MLPKRFRTRWMIRTVTGAGYEFKGEVLTLSPERARQQTDREAPSSLRASFVRWIAQRPGLASTLALEAGAALTGSLVLVLSKGRLLLARATRRCCDHRLPRRVLM